MTLIYPFLLPNISWELFYNFPFFEPCLLPLITPPPFCYHLRMHHCYENKLSALPLHSSAHYRTITRRINSRGGLESLDGLIWYIYIYILYLLHYSSWWTTHPLFSQFYKYKGVASVYKVLRVDLILMVKVGLACKMWKEHRKALEQRHYDWKKIYIYIYMLGSFNVSCFFPK